MAEWNKNKVDPSEINKGQEFINGDNLARDELNAIVNNSFYASEKAQRAEQLAESAVRGNGTLVTIGGQVQGEWSADFAESERLKSKNLFDKDAITKGVELVGGTGEERASEAYWVSEYINIQAMYALYCSGTRTSGTSFCYYSEDKTFISTQRLGEWVGQLTPPTNAVYLRFNGLLTELDDIQLEKGTVATDYQPYNGAIVHEKEIEDVEHIEVIYDKETGKTTLGGNDYGGGILGGVRVENLDLSKYKKLKIYTKFNRVYSNYLHDLAIQDPQGTCVLSSSSTEIMCIKASTNINKTVFEINEIGYFLTTFTSRNGNDTYYVYKIEGVY